MQVSAYHRLSFTKSSQKREDNRCATDEPVKNTRMTKELTMANQWMSSSVICKYTSHREAHLTGDRSHSTSYVQMTSFPASGSITCGRQLQFDEYSHMSVMTSCSSPSEDTFKTCELIHQFGLPPAADITESMTSIPSIRVVHSR